ncbi:hypothetical protein Lalb_Chr19g0132661 [Lupinus albus]|uniref:Uncharacterized protein n=1 Tax=Lupinus albus TaxID=3870 RepID=A0A6A4NTP6_LUPAL|nr:hypothetical protein Lalb_Chr19g0132661 [Lupinus albus]
MDFQMASEFQDRHTLSDMMSSNQKRKKQSFIRKILTMKNRNGKTIGTGSVDSPGELFHGNSF